MRNLLLAALPPDVYASLERRFERLAISPGIVLHEPGASIRHLYFPRRERRPTCCERARAALRKSGLLLANAHSLLDRPVDRKACGVAEQTTAAVGQDPNVC